MLGARSGSGVSTRCYAIEVYERVMAISTCVGPIGESMGSPPYDQHVNFIAPWTGFRWNATPFGRWLTKGEGSSGVQAVGRRLCDTSQSVFKNRLRSRPYVISKEAPHRTIGSHEILRAD